MRRQMLLLVVGKMRQMLLLLFIILWPIRGMIMVVDVRKLHRRHLSGRSIAGGFPMGVTVVFVIVATVVGNAAYVIVVVFRPENWRFLLVGVGKRRMLDVIRDKCCLIVVDGGGGIFLLHRRRSSEAARYVHGDGNGGGK